MDITTSKIYSIKSELRYCTGSNTAHNMSVLHGDEALSTINHFTKATYHHGRDKLSVFNSLSANPTKWSNTPQTIRRQQPTNCLSVFDHVVGLALKGLNEKL